MQSGRILPIVRQFFAPATRTTSGTTKDREGQSQQYSGNQERQATEEEAKQAAETLAASEEFKKNDLSVEVTKQNDKFALLVRNSRGSLLRTIPSPEIVKILLLIGTPDSPRQGRILDRRI